MDILNDKKKLNNKGFTLVEILAVIVIIGILGMISIPSVLSVVNSSNNAAYDILVKDITIAGKQLYEEIDYMNNMLYHYNMKGKTDTKIIIGKDLYGNNIGTNSIEVNFQTLISNNLLTSNNNTDKSKNKNDKVVINPKTKEDMGDCKIIITKIIDKNFNTSYQIINKSTDNLNCPLDSEYKEVNK